MKTDRMQNKTIRLFSFLLALLLVSSAIVTSLISHDARADSSPSPIEVAARQSNAGTDKTSEPAAADGQKFLRTDSRGIRSASERQPYQVYVTPDDQAIQGLAAEINGTAEAYALAARWIYVSDQLLAGEIEKWLTPGEFLTETANYSGNPVSGKEVSDCEEQAHALASLIRTSGTSPEEVRVALGKVKFGDVGVGHAWVELVVNGQWLALDPSSGPYWDDQARNVNDRQELPFDYYASRDFPVIQSWVYYNDVYYVDFIDGSGNAPGSWY